MTPAKKKRQEECKHLDIRPQNKARTRFRCADCEKWFNDTNVPDKKWKKPDDKIAPKVLLFDTENAPNLASVFPVWGVNIHPAQLSSDWYMLSWSAKWLNDSEVMGDVLTPKESIKEDDSRIARGIWNLMNEADIIIAHNAVKFDIPVVNTRFLLNGMNPPSPYQVIDTLKVARREFHFTHNKLDFLADRLGIEHKKLETAHQLWVDCRAGKQEALNYMLEYNKMDTVVLEEIYLRLRPFIKSHPNFNTITGQDGLCSTCGSTNLKQNSFYYTTVNKYNSYVCNDCGSYTRTGKAGGKGKVVGGYRSIAR